MAQTAAHLIDRVIPHVPVRQWVLSLPIPLRLLLAAQPKLVTPVLQVVHRVITRHLLSQARLKPDEAPSGAVTLIQRFGSAANLNIHLHCLVLAGVYKRGIDGAPEFVEVPELTDEALQAVLHKIITRLMKLLTRRGVLVEEEGSTYMADNGGDSDEARVLRPLQAAACTYRIAFGPRAGQKVLTMQGAMPRDKDFKRALCADIDGFSLHAAVRCGADDRQALEQLCRYITRPALAPSPHFGVRPIVEQALRKAGRVPQVLVEANSLTVMVQVARTGLGGAMLSACSVADEVGAGELVLLPLAGGGLVRRVVVAMSPVEPQLTATGLVFDALVALARQQAGQGLWRGCRPLAH
jgi:hypothetical protein